MGESKHHVLMAAQVILPKKISSVMGHNDNSRLIFSGSRSQMFRLKQPFNVQAFGPVNLSLQL